MGSLLERQMPSKYECPKVDEQWSYNRETHPAVAAAIHAIASKDRSPEAIWENPTSAEWECVREAVEEYITEGLFPAVKGGAYPWGAETIQL